MFSWAKRLDEHFPVRYAIWLACAAGGLLAAFAWVAFDRAGIAAIVLLALAALGVRDTRQQRHAVLRNYPVIGHLRFLLEYIRPEMRQYFIEGDNEAAPFSRKQRSLVYQRAKGESDKRPFGTQRDVAATGYEWINHSMSPTTLPTHDFRVMIGAGAGTSRAWAISIVTFAPGSTPPWPGLAPWLSLISIIFTCGSLA